MSINIWYGSNEHKVLSNLSRREFYYLGLKFVSVEHAYQTLKGDRFDESIYMKPWKEGSKFIGKYTDKNTNVTLMITLIKASFDQNPQSKATLVNTGYEQLTHNQDRGIWKLMFPTILMTLREVYRSQ